MTKAHIKHLKQGRRKRVEGGGEKYLGGRIDWTWSLVMKVGAGENSW